MKGSILWPVGTDAWVTTVVKCLNEPEMGRCQRQNLYADSPVKILEGAMGQPIWNMGVFVQYWTGARWRVDPLMR